MNTAARYLTERTLLLNTLRSRRSLVLARSGERREQSSPKLDGEARVQKNLLFSTSLGNKSHIQDEPGQE